MGQAKIKKEQFRSYKACVYCGKLCKPTMDHVPPKGIFPPPRPLHLITVPACADCNGRAAQIDEAFKTAIALQVNPESSPLNAALAKAGHETLKNNKRLTRELLAGGQEVWIPNEYGNWVRTRTFLWPVRYHDEVVRRTTQGLYFHHTRKSLFELGCDVDVNYHGRSRGQMPEIARTMNVRSVGLEQFNYAFGVGLEDPRYSVWLYEFYGTHYASASTFPRGDPDFTGFEVSNREDGGAVTS